MPPPARATATNCRPQRKLATSIEHPNQKHHDREFTGENILSAPAALATGSGGQGDFGSNGGGDRFRRNYRAGDFLAQQRGQITSIQTVPTLLFQTKGVEVRVADLLRRPPSKFHNPF